MLVTCWPDLVASPTVIDGFYRPLLGWQRSGVGLVDGAGVLFATCGLVSRAPGWALAVRVAEPATVTARGQSVGGTVILTDRGRILTDLQGAVSLPRETVPTGLTPLWCQLVSTEPLSATGFYRRAYGWPAVARDDAPGPLLTMDGSAVTGLRPVQAEYRVAPTWAPLVRQDHRDDLVSRAERLGGSADRHPGFDLVRDPDLGTIIVA